MNPGHIGAGFAALIVPVGLTIFGLVMAVVTSWRRWLGLPPRKKLPPARKNKK